MLEVGQIFKRNDNELCLLKLIEYDNKHYALFSVENTKMEYLFYEVLYNTNNGSFNLTLVNDDDLNNVLFEIVEEDNSEN